MNHIPVGVDIAKNIFHVHHVDQDTGEIVNRPLKRAQFLEYFANRAPSLVGMEACGGAHHWARQLAKLATRWRAHARHECVKAFNIRNKNDAADAKAIWLAVQQPARPWLSKTKRSRRCSRFTGCNSSSSERCRSTDSVACSPNMAGDGAWACIPGQGDTPGLGAVVRTSAGVLDRDSTRAVERSSPNWTTRSRQSRQRMRDWVKQDRAVRRSARSPGWLADCDGSGRRDG